MYQAQLAELLHVGRLYRQNSETLIDPGLWTLRIDPGLWPPVIWDRADFRRWFLQCLHAKINRGDARQSWRKMADSYTAGLAHDARIIRDAARGVRWSGRNLLQTPELARRYPHLHNPEVEQ